MTFDTRGRKMRWLFLLLFAVLGLVSCSSSPPVPSTPPPVVAPVQSLPPETEAVEVEAVRDAVEVVRQSLTVAREQADAANREAQSARSESRNLASVLAEAEKKGAATQADLALFRGQAETLDMMLQQAQVTQERQGKQLKQLVGETELLTRDVNQLERKAIASEQEKATLRKSLMEANDSIQGLAAEAATIAQEREMMWGASQKAAAKAAQYKSTLRKWQLAFWGLLVVILGGWFVATVKLPIL